MDLKRFPTLQKLANRQEKRIEKFQDESSELFHSHAVTLCRRIQKGIPEFTGCHLDMRELYLEPMDIQIPIRDNRDGEEGSDRLQNILEYVNDLNYSVLLPQRTPDALKELDVLANYIDDNYSNVGELRVDLMK